MMYCNMYCISAAMLVLTCISCRYDGSTAVASKIGDYFLRGPLGEDDCHQRKDSCLMFTYEEAIAIDSVEAGWSIPTIDQWRRIIKLVDDGRITDIESRTIFHGLTLEFTELIQYRLKPGVNRIWIRGMIATSDGMFLRRVIEMKTVGLNRDNLIVMGLPVFQDEDKILDLPDEDLNPRALVYLIKDSS